MEEDQVVTKLIKLLDSSDKLLRRDVKMSLISIAELPDGFLSITTHLANHF